MTVSQIPLGFLPIVAVPWRVARSVDKKRARLNIITDILKQIPYEKTPRPKIELPKRDKAHGYVEVDYTSKLVPEVF